MSTKREDLARQARIYRKAGMRDDFIAVLLGLKRAKDVRSLIGRREKASVDHAALRAQLEAEHAKVLAEIEERHNRVRGGE